MSAKYLKIRSQFQYIEISEEEMETKSGLMENEAAKITQFYNLLTSSIDVIRTFCDRIPGIAELAAKDRDLLFQSACLELFTLRLAYRWEPGDISWHLISLPVWQFLAACDDNQSGTVAPGEGITRCCCRTQPESSKFTFCSGLVLHKNQARSTFGDWLNGIIEFSRSLHSMELDVSAFACLAALTLVNGKLVR